MEKWVMDFFNFFKEKIEIAEKNGKNDNKFEIYKWKSFGNNILNCLDMYFKNTEYYNTFKWSVKYKISIEYLTLDADFINCRDIPQTHVDFIREKFADFDFNKMKLSNSYEDQKLNIEYTLTDIFAIGRGASLPNYDNNKSEISNLNIYLNYYLNNTDKFAELKYVL
jgi:hypothetical protein